MTQSIAKTVLKTLLWLLVAGALAGCQGKVTLDLTSQAPAEATIESVWLDLDGVEFQREDGTTEQLLFTVSERLDLLTLDEGSLLRLITDEVLPDGEYVGVRLVFSEEDDADSFLRHLDGGEYPIAIDEGEYAGMSLSVVDDDSSRAALILTLDLRQSLQYEASDLTYRFVPLLRSAESGSVATLSGTVAVTCATNDDDDLSGRAVYAFEGEVVPDDRDLQGVEPYLTTAVFATSDGGHAYAFDALPPGRYTVAHTCDGELEYPQVDDLIEFGATQVVDVSRGADEQQDL